MRRKTRSCMMARRLSAQLELKIRRDLLLEQLAVLLIDIFSLARLVSCCHQGGTPRRK